jgi:hypothetical protein
LWRTFVDKFERFTPVLCTAAQYGVTQASEQEYLDLRTWFLDNYYELAPRLRPHMGSDVFGRLAGAYASQDRALDGFEAIFLPRTLNELLARDSGDLICVISQLSQAVYSVEV